ncbi:MAG TPA: LuxR C-terminal-related transcriptional regulator [Acidimicrobiales bacterium]|nr:LuxR C-terminal-related transcriptional regulator [Acidimicrobiales bacterium]
MSRNRSVVDLREALADLVSVGAVPGLVREEIGDSWRRSVGSGLRPDRFEVRHEANLDPEAPLLRAASPVLDELIDDVAAVGLGVLLTDEAGRVLDRRVSDVSLRAQLDRILLAPGSVYAEAGVGTNAIGTALEERGPSVVNGREHFADALTAMTCAAWPIADVRNGRVLGVVDLSCVANDANPLMLPLVRRAAREVERRLLGDASAAERVLLHRFSRDRQAARGPLVVLNESTMLTNPAAKRAVDPGDGPVLWQRVLSMLDGSQTGRDIPLSRGTVVVMSCEPVVDGGELVGASVRLSSPDLVAAPHPAPRGRQALGWGSLTDTERSVADLVCEGMTNRQAAERLLMSPYTVDTHLRSIFRKLGVNSRVDLTRAAFEQQGADAHSPDTSANTATTVDRHPSASRKAKPTRSWT